jgi:HPt (histidine-containing phosphotransfer) domain-containing protein
MSSKPYDIRSAALALGLKPEVIGDLIKKMAPSAEKHVGEIKKLMKKKDHNGIYRIAHTLKGLASNFRFEGMAETARSLETAAKDNNEGIYAVLLAGLEEELKEIKEVAAGY